MERRKLILGKRGGDYYILGHNRQGKLGLVVTAVSSFLALQLIILAILSSLLKKWSLKDFVNWFSN